MPSRCYCTQIVSREGVFCKKTRVTSAPYAIYCVCVHQLLLERGTGNSNFKVIVKTGLKVYTNLVSFVIMETNLLIKK